MEVTLLTREEINEMIWQTAEEVATVKIVSPPEVMTIKELADYLRVSVGTIRNRIKDEGLPVFNKLGLQRFLKPEVDAWMKER